MRHVVLLLAAAALIAGCAKPIREDRPATVLVPVTAPCADPRPAHVISLRDRIPRDQWQAKSPKQKAAEVGAQGLRRQTYGEQLEAATAACP